MFRERDMTDITGIVRVNFDFECFGPAWLIRQP